MSPIETLKSVPLTFYSSSIYQRVVRHWRGIGIGFILFTTLIQTISVAVIIYQPMHEVAERIMDVAETLPDATIKNGELSIKAESPWSTEIFKNDRPGAKPDSETSESNRLVIDTNYKIDDVDALMKKMNNENIFILVTNDKIVTHKNNAHSIQIDNFKSVPDSTFNHEAWIELGEKAHKWMYPFMIILSIFGTFLLTFLNVLIGAILVQITATVLKADMDFSASMRLSATAIVPVGIIASVFPSPFWVKCLLWIGYAVFGLLSVRNLQQEVI